MLVVPSGELRDLALGQISQFARGHYKHPVLYRLLRAQCLCAMPLCKQRVEAAMVSSTHLLNLHMLASETICPIIYWRRSLLAREP